MGRPRLLDNSAVLRGVIEYLQARWEEFTERDVGIFVDLGEGRPGDAETLPLGPGEADPVFWLVTSRARTKMAEAQHDAYMDYVARQKAAQGFDSASAEGGNAVDETKFIDGSGEEVDLDKELLEARSKAVWRRAATGGGRGAERR